MTVDAKTVSEILDVLAVKFGTAAGHLWDVLVRQLYIEAAFSTVLAVIFTIATVVMGRKVYAWWTVDLAEGGGGPRVWADSNEELAVLGSIVAVLCAIVAAFAIGIAIFNCLQLMNPEYGALKLVGRALNPTS
jgi:hypothetical protein